MQLNWSKFYTYNKVNINLIRDERGVYLIWVRLKSGKYRCIYVGKTDTLQTRLNEHLSESEENKCLKNNLSQFECGFECALVPFDSVDGVEAFLIKKYSAECNTNIPSATLIEVNLP